MPAGLYDSLITQLSLQIDKKTTLSKKFKYMKNRDLSFLDYMDKTQIIRKFY